MFRALRIHMLVVVIAALTAVALMACGGDDEEARGFAAREDRYADQENLRAQMAMDRPSYMVPVDALKEIVTSEDRPVMATAPASSPGANSSADADADADARIGCREGGDGDSRGTWPNGGG